MFDEGGQIKVLAPRFPLNVLIVEDNPDDAELCLRLLSKAQFDIQADVVKTAEEFARQLRITTYHVILADYNLGDWTGMDALSLLRQEKLETPLILVTGALGDQAAVECIKNGAADYILKDRMERLPVAIYRAIEEKSLRTAGRRTEYLVRESEAQLRHLTEAIPMALFVEEDTQCRYVNCAAERVTGYSRSELLAMHFCQLILGSSREALTDRLTKCLGGGESDYYDETRILTKKGEERWLDVTVRSFQAHGKLAALIAALDITDRKH